MQNSDNLIKEFLDTHGISMITNRLTVRQFKKTYGSREIEGHVKLMAEVLEAVFINGDKKIEVGVFHHDNRDISITVNGKEMIRYKKSFFFTTWKVKRNYSFNVRYNSKTFGELGDTFLKGIFIGALGGDPFPEENEMNLAAA